jgi:hypothetical protein
MLLRAKSRGRFVAEATGTKPPIVRHLPSAIFRLRVRCALRKRLAEQAAPYCCKRSGRAWRRVLLSRTVPSA